VIVGLFEVQNTIGVTMTNYMKILLDSFGLLDKVIIYASDESSNLNMLTTALKFIVSCFPLLLHAPFVGLCFDHAMSKAIQYATNDAEIFRGFLEVKI
jgi:hypothetical protein